MGEDGMSTVKGPVLVETTDDSRDATADEWLLSDGVASLEGPPADSPSLSASGSGSTTFCLPRDLADRVTATGSIGGGSVLFERERVMRVVGGGEARLRFRTGSGTIGGTTSCASSASAAASTASVVGSTSLAAGVGNGSSAGCLVDSQHTFVSQRRVDLPRRFRLLGLLLVKFMWRCGWMLFRRYY